MTTADTQGEIYKMSCKKFHIGNTNNIVGKRMDNFVSLKEIDIAASYKPVLKKPNTHTLLNSNTCGFKFILHWSSF